MCFAFATRCLSRQFVVAFGLAGVLGATALLEGRLPRRETLLALAPLVAFLGLGWSLSAWRQEGADIALAALGWRPVGPVLCGLMACAPLAVAPTMRSDAGDFVTTNQLVGPDGPRVIWTDGVAHRPDLNAPWPAFPQPTVASVEASPWPARVIGVLALLLLAGLLTRWPTAPGLALTVGSSCLAYGLGQLSRALGG